MDRRGGFLHALLLCSIVGAAGCSSPGDDAGQASAGTDGGSEGGSLDSGVGGSTGGGLETGLSGEGGDTGSASAGAEDTGDVQPDDTGAEGSSSSTTGAPSCDETTPVELFLSPDDSNSMSSPVQAREAALSQWASVSAAPIRTWEFFNYYSFDYPAAEPASVVVTPSLVHDEGMPEGQYVLQIGISSEAITPEQRPPMNLALVLDTSGSMEGLAMDMLKASCRTIAHNLRAGDQISLVTWNTENAILLGGHTVDGPDDPMLLEAIDSLSASGGTDLSGGLQAGYDLAGQVYDPDRINRLVLISDGGANVGVTDVDLIAAQAELSGGDGIYMVGVGVGEAGDYNDRLMDQVTDAGKGASIFIASEAEAQRIFGERFLSSLSVAVRDVQVELDLPPGFEIVKFSGEEYSSNPSEVEPQHLAPNDAMVFHQQISTCAPALATDDAPIVVTARFEHPIAGTVQEVRVETSFGELLAADATQLRKGAAVFAYAEGLKAYKAATDEAAQAAAVAQARAAIVTAQAALPGDADLLEMSSVLDAL
ncbi:MAG: VWA domain-containing protein [Nannocystaceae bacterium]|nr:VWA domain-containing protein [Nannocystaceae bacterium]